MDKKHKQSGFITFLRFIAKPVFKLLYGMKIEGLENLPKSGGYVVCCNHISVLDPVFWLIQTKRAIHYMGKAELFENKLLAWFFKKLNAFPVDRGKGDMTSIQHAIDIVKDGSILGIFPEGTRSKDGTPGRAKSGAAYIANLTEADVVPMAVICKGKVKAFSRVKLKIGKPIPYSEIHFEATDRKGLRNASKKIMGDITELWENGRNEY